MFNFISIGYDCSPAAALRVLNYRNFALPFDWINTNIKGLNQCFEEDFSRFHTNLKYNHSTQEKLLLSRTIIIISSNDL